MFQEFYNSNSVEKFPRVFGMTASPIIGKGNDSFYQYCIPLFFCNAFCTVNMLLTYIIFFIYLRVRT